jgi:phospholipase/lecithinase/hemolysin
MGMISISKRWFLVGLIVLTVAAPNWASAMTFKRIVVFGTSLSDPGNAFALTGEAIKQPYSELDDFLIPSAPYVTGGHHFSNGATWVEQFARRLDVGDSVEPAFGESQTATNYAIGGARARADGLNINLPDQVAVFLSDVAASAPATALYVIDMGSNDVRDALLAGSLAEAQAILADALASIGGQMANLYGAGARKFLVLNVPNLGVLPSIQILDSIFPGAAAFAGILAETFNANLDSVIASLAALPGVEIARLNVHQKVNDLIANPAKFGLKEVSVPCITPDVRPFTCKKPDRFLFWDGIHPTKAVHAILAKEAAVILDQ